MKRVIVRVLSFIFQFVPPSRIWKIERLRLRYTSRFNKTKTYLKGKSITIPDGPSFKFIYEEIFIEKIYHFTSFIKEPLIIDCGANIGLGIVYWKNLYPNSKIIGFEPNKKIFPLLEEIIFNKFKFKNVTLFNKGLWGEDKELAFFEDGADSGRIIDEKEDIDLPVMKFVRLSNILKDKEVDFLKIDIEGAEISVIEECEKYLYNVKLMFVEYHSFRDKKQELDKLLKCITNSGFRYVIHHIGVYSPNPFIEVNTYNSMDLQLNIYAFRY